MKTLKGERVKLKPDSIRSYTFYMENTYRSKNDPYYYPKTWINWGDEFYEVIYKDNGPVSVLKYQSVGNGNYTSPPEYYFERNGSFTPFSPTRFRYDAAIYFSDCPEAVNFLMNVPNEKNPKKIHNATFDDVDIVTARYNQCLSSKK